MILIYWLHNILPAVVVIPDVVSRDAVVVVPSVVVAVVTCFCVVAVVVSAMKIINIFEILMD